MYYFYHTTQEEISKKITKITGLKEQDFEVEKIDTEDCSMFYIYFNKGIISLHWLLLLGLTLYDPYINKNGGKLTVSWIVKKHKLKNSEE